MDKVAPVTQAVKSYAADIVLSPRIYEDAYRSGMSVSAYLEKLDKGEYKDGLDAFERQLKLAGIRTRSNPGAGVWASKVSDFWRSDRAGSEVLFPEFCARVWRKASNGEFFIGDQESRFYMSNDTVSDWLVPSTLAAQMRQKQIAASLPLSQFVAITTTIDTGAYIAFYLTDDSASYTMARVGEGAEVPTARLTGGDHAIRVRKYGRRLLGTYETFRRLPLDRFALHMALLAVKAEKDKVAHALSIIENGDGNTGTTPTDGNLTTYDANTVAGTITTTGYLAWKMKWQSPYMLNTVVCRESFALQLMELQLASGTPFWTFPQGVFGGLNVINTGFNSGVALGWTDDVTDNYLVGIDNRFALEMVVEAGASLTETNKIISSQFNEIVITESLGWCILDANANRRMAVNA